MEYNDDFYRGRLRALQPVDELVNDIFRSLEQYGILDNTYVIYSSDNGYHIGQHRLPPGKECGYEEDVNVPLIIRGPGVPKGVTTNQVTSHTDLVPTILQLVGSRPEEDFDGAAIQLGGELYDTRHEHVNIEYWGFALAEGRYGFVEHDPNGKTIPMSPPSTTCDLPSTLASDRLVRNNTYKAVRVIGEDYNLYYSVWCNNEHEFYDLTVRTVPSSR